PDDRAVAWKSIEDHLKGLTPVHQVEYRMRTKDGQYRWILDRAKVVQRDASGNPVRMSGTHTDITERKKAEAERTRLIMAFEQVDEGIMITDSDGIIQFANPAFERLAGYGCGELVGRHARVLTRGSLNRSVYSDIINTLVRGEAWSGLISTRRRDGTVHEVQALSSPVKDGSGNIVSYINIHRDVTLERKLERDLRQAQKMESIGTLAGGIAHDFNNILAIILGYSELSLTRLRPETPLHQDVTNIMTAALRAKDLVNQILTFSRQTEQKQQTLQMTSVVRDALKLLRSTLPSTIEIRQEIEIAPENSTVLADLTQIHQVLMNLCTNAAHAMRASGTLTVRLSKLKSSSPILPSGFAGKPFIELSVTDTGHGMNAATIERIFDPYFTTKSSGEGTGLGLSVVQGIVKGHGGEITVESKPGWGTTFRVFFPALDGHTAEEATAYDRPPSGRERILFVDDEQFLVELGKSILERLGYKVTARSSSREALETFLAEPFAFDLVITDMTMPELTGIALAERLWAAREDIPVILCSGFNQRITPRQAEELGIKEYVTKPYSMTALAKAVRKVLDRE
ncbi:MAG: PAS domain S-box protein, partial [Acidobacteriota bacterium]